MSVDNIEDIYRLSPVQEGMLFHTLYDPLSSVYVDQVVFTIEGDLRLSVFEQAWQRVLERHTVLRSGFAWEGIESPVHVVHRHAKLPFQYEDWSQLGAKEQEEQFESLVRAERKRGFDLTEPPLIRLYVLRVGPQTHRVIWTFHHILLDGWSFPLVLQEALSFYDAITSGKEVQVEASRSYGEFIEWLQRQDMQKAESFWRETLKGFLAPTPLPMKSNGSNKNDSHENYRVEETRLSQEATARLQNLARQQGLTLNTIVQGAWGLLLARYSGSSDVVFGATVSGRPAELTGVETMIGLFINTLPVRVEVDESEEVISWLKQLQQQQVEMRQYEYSPLVEIHKWSKVLADLPLFESILVFENYPLDQDPSGQTLTLKLSNFRAYEMTNYPLSITAGVSNTLVLRAYYETDLFQEGAITDVLSRLCISLEAMSSNPRQRLEDLSILSVSEMNRMLVEWNDTSRDYPAEQCIQQLFEQTAEQFPHQSAVICGDGGLTYQELNQRANQLAHHLMSKGVGPESRVGICVERGIDMVAGLLGILKAGAAYVPLDPEYPPQRLSYMMEDSGVEVVITQSDLLETVASDGVEGVCLDREWAEIASQPTINPDVIVEADNLAYVIYTSGSTGLPKGVAVSHKSVARLVCGVDYVELGPQTVILQMGPLAFDASTFEIWGAVLNGGRCVVMGERVAGAQEIGRAIREQEVTTIFITTALFNAVVEEGVEELRGVRQILTGGEAVSERHVRRGAAEIGEVEVVHVYGPTEGTTFTTSYRVEKQGAEAGIPIGRPITNTQVYVLDRQMRPVPVGVAGELYISGAGLARGYINKADQTAERFLPNPYSEEGGGRMYRTGDVCRYRESGEIEYIGRADNQVKVRGYRIELGEVEAALMRREGVRQAVVIVREEEQAGKRLVAYVVEEEGEEVMWAELRQELRQELPEYMVPTAYVKLEQLPLTPNGKVDRGALPEEGREEARSSYSGLRSAEEEIIAGIWEEVLGVEKVGVDEDFFELGGHSLLATRVISQLRETFQIDLPLREIFGSPTVSGLAASVKTLRAGEGLIAPPIKPVPRDQKIPLSFAQQRLWFLNQLAPGIPLYNTPTALRLTGPLDMAAFEGSINQMLMRHEALRTRFVKIDLEVVQLIDPPSRIIFPIVDLSELHEREREAEAQRLATEEAQRPFDMARGPLLRSTFLRLEPQDHVWLLTMHHIITDGWSVGIFVDELMALYDSFCNNRPSPLRDLPFQYADFTVWQREWLRGEVLKAGLSHWKQKLGGDLPVLNLPTDYPRGPVQTYNGGHERFILSAELSQSLRMLSRREGVTLFMTLLAAYDVLLHRYTGQEDILVGIGVANRNHAGTQALIGFFVNMLVMRGNLTGNPTFSELLERVREDALDAYAHQDVPFERIVEELQPEGGLSRSPIFQVVLHLQNVPMQELVLEGLTLSSLDTENPTAKFDLMVDIFDNIQELIVVVEYNSDLFKNETIRRMINHFQTMLEALVADTATRIGDLPMLSEFERHQLLVDWNQTELHLPHDLCLQDLFERQAEQFPNHTAAVYEKQETDFEMGLLKKTHERKQITYQELNSRANQVANYLRAKGVGPEARVGILVDRSIDMLVGMVGIIKAGAAYVPFDTAYPKERVAYMAEDAQVQILLTQLRLIELAERQGVEAICLDADWDIIAEHSQKNPPGRASLDNLAYIIYTSGSTGLPKGVGISQKSLINLVTWHQQTYHVSSTDRATQIAALGFDASVWEIWPYLLAGASLHIAGQEERSDPKRLMEWMVSEEITISFVPTVLAEEMMGERWAEGSVLRSMLVGGDRLRRRPRRGEGWRVVNHYGPTEGTVVSTRGEVKEEGEGEPTIGRPITNTQVYVLDGEKRPVPVGVAGELYISGAGLARGYINKADQTAERFLPNPYSEEGGGRMYRTGDVCRYRESGEIEYIGRADNQVKVRGYRIELGEVEAALLTHPAVERAVVVARPDHQQSLQLVGYLVASADESLDLDELRRELAEKLPDYMVPTAFVRLERLPVNANGKVDRNALPAPDEETSEEQGNYIAPRTPTEEIIAGIWAEVLGLERVSIHDDFLLLRGHSLLATQVISRVRMIFQVELPLRALFEAPTVAGLAATIDAAYKRRTAEAAPPIRRVPREANLPLSYAQQRLWFLNQLEPHSSVYNVPAGLRLTGRLDTLALERSLSRIVSRHEALRTVFPSVGGKPVQRINPARYEHLAVADLSELGDESREAEVRRLSGEQALRSFDLAEGPVMRSVLVKEEIEEHVLMVCMHHIVTDGWSIGVMVKELAAMYEAYGSGREPEEEELEVQYADYAVWQREWLEGGEMQRQLGYWREQLAGAPMVLDVSADRARGAEESHRGSQYTRLIGGEVWEGMKMLSRQEGVTLYMSLLAGFEVLMSRYSGEEEMLIGTPIAGRNRAEVEGLIGFFVNTLVMRGDVRGRPSVREMLRRVRRVAMEGYANQDVPFERVVEEMEVERDLSRTPIFQVMFVMQNAPVGELEMEGLKLDRLEGETTTALFDLTFSTMESSDGLVAMMGYNTDLYEEETIKRMLGHYERILEGMVEDASTRVSDLSLLRETERRQMLEEWNETGAEYPSLCIQQIYEQQAKESPDATAVISRGKALTYAELNERANQLAHHLMRKGIRAESRVGICVERGIDMVAGLLGILKTGAAYVPLDPEYPPQRLSYMMDDSGVEVVITQSSLLEVITSDGVEAVCLDREWAEISGQPTLNPDVKVEADNLAYVIYTSGSTGLPKGVAIQHNSASAFLHWAAQEFGQLLGSVLATTSVCFDLSVFEIFAPLSVGGKVVVSQGPLAVTAEEAGEVRLINTVPSAIEEMVRGGRIGAGVRGVNLAGEALRRRIVEQVYGESSVEEVRNLYGPSEYTTYATMREEKRGEEGEPLIGRPITNTQVYVLDGEKRPVPVGVAGELYISGAGLARGYINKADQTAERFLPNPYSEEGGGRMYRTGDVCRYREGGEIEYIGRADNQVKVRGYRIELGEVEAALMRREGVRQAVVIVREEEQAGKRLVAYVVEEEGAEVNVAELRQELKQELPEYMVPAMYVKLEQMPLTPNGKVDRKALPVDDRTSPSSSAAYQQPSSPAEIILAQIWQQVLSVEKVGVNDNFFELGGDSILSIQVVARANEAGLSLSPKQMFQHQSIGELARVAGESRRVEAEQGRVSGDVELTAIQEWFFEWNEVEVDHWNQSVLVEMKERVQGGWMREAVRGLLEQHDVLRSRYEREEGRWRQEIKEEEKEEVYVEVDVSEVSEERQREEIERVSEQMQRSLRLTEGPIVRVGRIEVGDREKSRMVVIVHHLGVDGVSWRILLEDLERGYRQAERGEEVRLGRKTTSWKYWANKIKEYAQTPEVEQEVSYWAGGKRRGIGNVPVDFVGGDNTGARIALVVETLSEDETRELLQDVSQVYKTQISEILLAALARTIMRWTGNEEVVIDVEGHGREELFEEVDLTKTVGWFTTIYPLSINLSKARTLDELVKVVKEEMRAVPRKGVGYGLLRYVNEREEIRKTMREVEEGKVSFNYLGQFDQVVRGKSLYEMAEEWSGMSQSKRCERRYVLEVSGQVGGGRLQLSWIYSRGLHRRETIEKVAGIYQEELRRIIEHCKDPAAGGYTPSDFPLADLDQKKFSKLSVLLDRIDQAIQD